MVAIKTKLILAQIETIQAALSEIAAGFQYSLFSPFADKHGFFEVEYTKRQASGAASFISIAVDTLSGSPKWRCQFVASAVLGSSTRSSIVESIKLHSDRANRDELASLFARAVITASRLTGELPSEREDATLVDDVVEMHPHESPSYTG